MSENFDYCDRVTIEEEQQLSLKNRFVQKALNIRCIEDAWIIPWSDEACSYKGEVVDSHGSVVRGVNSGIVYSEEQKMPLPQSAEEAEEVIYLGSVPPGWGHYITDGISKLWCLHNSQLKGLIEKGVPVVFTPMYISVISTPNAWRRLMDNAGWESVDVQPLLTTTHYRRVWIPDNSLFCDAVEGRLFTKEYYEVIKQIKHSVLNHYNGRVAPKKLYFSRTKLPQDHGEFGEICLERAFRKQGFVTIYPEKLSIEEQIWLLDQAESVVGTMGSITHNFVFCQPGTEATILRKAWYTNDFQYVINQAARINVTYVDCHLSVFTNENPNLGPFYLYINENVRRFFADKFGTILPDGFRRRMFQDYIMACITRPAFDRRTVSPSYYYQKMQQEMLAHQHPVRLAYRSILALLPQGLRLCIRRLVNSIRK